MPIIRFACQGFACCGLIVACLLAGVAEGQSIGRWRLPSTPAQYFGCGVGPGHHAPMVRAPRYQPPRMQRITITTHRRAPFCHNTGVSFGCQPSLPMQQSPHSVVYVPVAPVVPAEPMAPAEEVQPRGPMAPAVLPAPVIPVPVAPAPAVETSSFRTRMFAAPPIATASH